MRMLTLLLLSLVAGGCAGTVRPVSRPLDPVAVYLTDYGVHSSLVLPVNQGGYVEYCFGDWGYAVENHDAPNDAVGALMVSEGSAFGRRYLAADPQTGEPVVPTNVTPSLKHISRLVASREKVDSLLKELDDRYRRDPQPPTVNPENGIAYVRDEQPYSISNNCNHLTAAELEQLGFEVEGPTWISGFHVSQPLSPGNSAGTAIVGDSHAAPVDHLGVVTSD